MSALTFASRRAAVFLALLGVVALAGANARASDVYDAAVGHAGRSSDDLKRDSLDHPADVLRLAPIKPGMRVADFLAGDGYYSELLSYLVGPKGHVYLLNNTAYDTWSEGHWKERIEGRLPNVEHRTIDAILLIKVYHDLYWVDEDPKDNWPKYDVSRVLNEIDRVVKPGGILLLVDHSAKAGSGSADAGSLHRIDEAYARHDFEKHGFSYVSTSDVLRKPEDPRDQITYKGPMVGKTDRFVMVFRRNSTP